MTDQLKPNTRQPSSIHTEEMRQRVIKYLTEMGEPQPRGALCKACNIPQSSAQFILKDKRFGTVKNGRYWLKTLNSFVKYEARDTSDRRMCGSDARAFKITFTPRKEAPPPEEYVKVISDLLYQKQPLFLEEIARYTKIPRSSIFAIVNNNPGHFERIERVYWLAGEVRRDSAQTPHGMMETTQFLRL